MQRLRTALVVAVPEAGPVVDAWRERTCEYPPSAGVPAHVTLVFPFAPAERVDGDVLAQLRELFAGHPAFPFALRATARFPRTLYLVPEPSEPFVALTRALAERFPEFPPYRGLYAAVVPHLTVAEGPPETLDAAAADVEPALPLEVVARKALLLVEATRDPSSWTAAERFPLGGA